MKLNKTGKGLSRECWSASEDFVEYQAKSIQIAPDGHLSASDLFRRHVSRRTCTDLAVPDPLCPACYAKVSNADLSAPVEHDVGRFQVAVQNTRSMGSSKPQADLARGFVCLVKRESADSLEHRGELLAVHVLHRQEVGAIGFPDVEGAADVRVRDLAGKSDLVAEAGQPGTIRRQVRFQELDGYGLIECQILGAVHNAHGAATKE